MRIPLKTRLQQGKTALKGSGFVGPNIWYSTSVLDSIFLMNQIVWIQMFIVVFGLVVKFFGADRIKAVRKMIMAVTTEQRKASLDILLPYQRSDFEGIFRAMDGKCFESFL